MQITRVSMFTGVEKTLEIDVTKEQLVDYYEDEIAVIGNPYSYKEVFTKLTKNGL